MKYIQNIRRITPLLLIAALLFSGSEVWAQLVQLRLVSSANAWQRQDTIGLSSNHIFGYQTAQLSVAGEHLSFHTYLQGFRDFAGPLTDRGAFRINNVYLKYSNLYDMVDISLGRQTIFAGVGNGTIDGANVSARFLDSRIKFVGYAGMLPPIGLGTEISSSFSDNHMLGVQVIGRPVDFAKVSLSYMKKSEKMESYWAKRAFDSTYAVQSLEIKPAAAAEEYVSGDVSLDYNIVSAYARGDIDLKLEKLSRIQLFTRVKVMEPLALTGEFIRREPRLSYNSIFWVFAYNTMSEYEFGAEYTLCKDWQVFGKYGAVSYGEGDNSNRMTLGGSMKYASVSFSWNTGYGGELAALSANGGYPLFHGMLTPTLMVGFASYKLNSNAPQASALSIGAGAVYRPSTVLSLDVQVQLIQNKVYNNDLRLFFRGSYYLSERLNIF